MPKLEPMPDDNMYQAYGIYLLESKHRLIRRLKKAYQPSVHGHKTWNASFLLMDYLQYEPLAKKSRVLEVGCGWGPGSVYCAHQFKAKVTGLDIDDEVFPFLEVLAELNDVKVKPLVKRFESLKVKELSAFDVIVGSDVCFWDSMVKPLSQFINRALKSGVERVVITDPGRPTFYELCDIVRKKHKVELQEWYATEPSYTSGEVVEIRAR
ncbi:MAG: class I SAM-dependent methyltransferase [Gammaproteobacteria bacterium]|nr:class I SAM-dependent methyltransferase [Gammaproteobacteria bacterium]MCZ6854210.1 class I SAM-dependent methyltransferase [Gammaproteobacteria bacterium]